MDTSKTQNSTRIPNLASKIGATCHIFRDIDVFSAFSLAARFGRNHGKSTENVNISKCMTVAPIFEARFGILVEFGVLEVSTLPSAKYHPYAYMSAD